MKYAVIKMAGSQYRVEEGQELAVFQIEGKEGDKINLNEVLLYQNDDKILIGQPLLAEVLIKGVIVKNLRGEKIRVATYKAKSRYRRVKGHRDELTKVRIESITLEGEKPTEAKVSKPKVKTVKVTKVVKKAKKIAK